MCVAGDWTYLDGSDLRAGIETEECWVSGVETTNIPKSSGNQIAWGQCGAMRISSHWSCWAFTSTCGNRAGGGYAYAHSAH